MSWSGIRNSVAWTESSTLLRARLPAGVRRLFLGSRAEADVAHAGATAEVEDVEDVRVGSGDVGADDDELLRVDLDEALEEGLELGVVERALVHLDGAVGFDVNKDLDGEILRRFAGLGGGELDADVGFVLHGRPGEEEEGQEDEQDVDEGGDVEIEGRLLVVEAAAEIHRSPGTIAPKPRISRLFGKLSVPVGVAAAGVDVDEVGVEADAAEEDAFLAHFAGHVGDPHRRAREAQVGGVVAKVV